MIIGCYSNVTEISNTISSTYFLDTSQYRTNFHRELEEVQQATAQKLKQLEKEKKQQEAKLNTLEKKVEV
jgi:hypothetical protein